MVTSRLVAEPLVLSTISTVLVSRCNERPRGSNPPRQLLGAPSSAGGPGPGKILGQKSRSKNFTLSAWMGGGGSQHDAARRRQDVKDGGRERGAVGG